MNIKSNIKIKYKNEEYAQIAYKTLDIDNKGFVKSTLNQDTIRFNIESKNLGSFLATSDDLISSEILVEDILKNIKSKI